MVPIHVTFTFAFKVNPNAYSKQGITPLNTTASIIMYANNLSSKFCASLRKIGNEIKHYKGDAVLVATGASENMVNFKGWTLPGVIGAGAAQTMMNLHHIKPGKRVLMLGSGNVGLVVSFQHLQTQRQE